MININSLKSSFSAIYGKPDDKPLMYFAPGRVNLIGEHTDYNGGYVLPCAIEYGTYLLIRKSSVPLLKFASTNMPAYFEIPLEQASEHHGREWVNYPLGVIDQFSQRGFPPIGLEMLFSGDIPDGAGLSSSASIEMVTAVALNEILNSGFERVHLAKLSQKAENEFAGMNCGIMDQFASGLGEKDHAIFLNCATLNYTMVKAGFTDVSLVITNSNKKRGLVDSAYNERRAQCEEAVRLISAVHPVQNLSQLAPPQLERLETLIPDETIMKRVRHVVSENMRVLEGVKALFHHELGNFGILMYESHYSLREDYEVSCRELDVLVEAASSVPGTIGSRMTGGGFGGCTVSFVNTAEVEDFIRVVGAEYKKQTGITAGFYTPAIGDGACRLE